jgi:hypothetical protein
LALAAVFCYVRALRRDGNALSLLAAVFYLAASLAKEIYVPLVVLFIFLALPRPRPARLLAPPLPQLAAFFAYLAWRFYMLGNLGGGYGWTVQAADLPRLGLTLPLKLALAIAGPTTAASSISSVTLASPGFAASSAVALGCGLILARPPRRVSPRRRHRRRRGARPTGIERDAAALRPGALVGALLRLCLWLRLPGPLLTSWPPRRCASDCQRGRRLPSRQPIGLGARAGDARTPGRRKPGAARNSAWHLAAPPRRAACLAARAAMVARSRVSPAAAGRRRLASLPSPPVLPPRAAQFPRV